MSIRCPKCHASAASLELRVEHLEAGTVLQVVTCLICRFRAERQVVTPQHARAAAPVPPAPTPSPMNRGILAAHATMQASRTPCTVRGCEGTYIATHSKTKLCRGHRLQLERWVQKKPSTPPPLALVNGVWILRGEPLPGIPGERPAPAWDAAETPATVGAQHAASAPPRPKRARAQRGGKNRARRGPHPALRPDYSNSPAAATRPAGPCS